MSKAIEGVIECPFYKTEGEKFISCEGYLKNSTTVTHRFSSDEKKRNYEYDFCCVNGGRRCPHYRNLMILYERGEKL
jgi:hypothetical protein